jgi:hypothetical protein
VKPKEGTATEYLDYVGQVIAEIIACQWTNSQNMYDSPTLAILCDGRNLQFFELSKHNEETKFRLGKFSKGETRLVIPDISPRDAVEDFDAEKTIRQLRSVCEALDYTFLKGYLN